MEAAFICHMRYPGVRLITPHLASIHLAACCLKSKMMLKYAVGREEDHEGREAHLLGLQPRADDQFVDDLPNTYRNNEHLC